MIEFRLELFQSSGSHPAGIAVHPGRSKQTSTGHVSPPGHRAQRNSMSFTSPLHLFSLEQGIARSSQRWYRIGHPSPLAEDSLRRWSVDWEI